MSKLRNKVKQWFINFLKPTQAQFYYWMDSTWFKDEKIPTNNIEGLSNLLNQKADNEIVNQQLLQKVDKVVGKQLSTNDYTNEEKQKLEGLVNYVLPQILANIKQTDISAWNDAKNKKITAFTITGDTNKLAKITLADGSVLQTNFVDIDTNTDVKLNSLAFDNLTGVATAVTSDGNTITASFDGRYSLINHEHEASDILGLNGYLGNLHNDILMAKQELYAYAEALCEKTQTTVDLTTLDQNKYYPVIIDITIFPKTHKITVSRDYNSSYGVPSYATHPQGFSCLLEWNCNSYKGSIAPLERTVLKVEKRNVLEVVFGDIGQMDFTSLEYIYLRGGSKYDIEVQGNSNATITLLTSNYTQLNQTLTIRDYVAEPTVTFATIRDLDKKDVKIYDIAGNFKHTYVDNKIKIGKGIKINETTGVIEVDESYIDDKIDDIDFSSVNLLNNSCFFKTSGWNGGWANNGGGYAVDNTVLFKGKSTLITTVGSGLLHPFIKLENGKEYTFSAMVKALHSFAGSNYAPLHYHAGKDNKNEGKIQVLKCDTSLAANKWKLIYITFKLTADADSFRPFIYFGSTLQTTMNIAYINLVRGNRPLREASRSAFDVQAEINGKNIGNQIKIKASSHADAATKGVAIGDFYINSSTGTLTQRLS